MLATLAVLAGGLMRVAPDRMPQALAGGDVLSVLLGDAKKDISGAMLHEADSYFHGGVDMDCHHLHDHGHDHGRACDHEHEHVHEHEHGHDHDSVELKRDPPANVNDFDPWRWINSRIRAPEIDRHLSDDKSVEMMPWFWMAVQADPHNVKAWSAAWYTAFYMMKDESLALRVASDGWRQNPSSLELACALGRTYRAGGARDSEKSEEMFRKVVEMAERMEKLDDDDSLAFFGAVGYLADSARRRKSAKELESLLGAARRINPRHPTTIFIGNALGSINSAVNP